MHSTDDSGRNAVTEAAGIRPLRNLTLADGRTVRVDDTGAGRPLFWHAGSPHTGALHEPLLSWAAERGIRLIEVTRPGYGGATELPERRIADAAADVLEVADALGLDRFAVFGSSGGGPHALAVAALAPGRVSAVAVFASPAPFENTSAWWDGMADDGSLRAATAGRDARLAHPESFTPEVFVDADYAALDGAWAPLGEEAGRANDAGGVGLVDDDVALTRPWGVELAAITAPVLLVHGRRDRMIPPAHSDLLAASIPDVTQWWRDDDGHVSVLNAVPDALEWILTR